MRPVRVLVFVVAFAVAVSAKAQRTTDEANSIMVFKKVAPLVVHVQSVIGSTADGQSQAGGIGTGSGFIIDGAGHVLTNYHVVENATEVRLLLAEGGSFVGRLVGTAPAFDLALLQIENGAAAIRDLGLPQLGDSDLVEIGQKVLAIGNPLGLHNTLTTGIISGRSRDIPGAPVGLEEAFIQTDAAISPGSSGGPLVDSAGAVIGINTLVARGGQNLGFAIPINFVKKIVPELVSMGHAYKPNLGFSAIPISPGFSSLLGLTVKAGLLVQEVLEGSSASLAGIKGGNRMIPMGDNLWVVGGDVIVAVNGRRIASPHSLTVVLLGGRPGDKVQFELLRDGVKRTVDLILPPMHF